MTHNPNCSPWCEGDHPPPHYVTTGYAPRITKGVDINPRRRKANWADLYAAFTAVGFSAKAVTRAMEQLGASFKPKRPSDRPGHVSPYGPPRKR